MSSSDGYEVDEYQRIVSAKRSLLAIHKQRKQILEEQAAISGIAAAPALLLMEIPSITTQITALEEELSRLATDAVVNQFSLADAEYRVLLAEAWDTHNGKPSIASRAKLELMRLKFGIPQQRAEQLEAEIREQLVREIFADIDLRPLFGILSPIPIDFSSNAMQVYIQPYSDGTVNIHNLHVIQQSALASPLEVALKALGKVIRLQHHVALELFLLFCPKQQVFDLEAFRNGLLATNRSELSSDEQYAFNSFLLELEQKLPAVSIDMNTTQEESYLADHTSYQAETG